MGTLLALLSSVLWGTSDFLGGTASRRLSPIGVVVVSEAVGTIGPLGVAIAMGDLGTSPDYVGWAFLAAVSGSAGIVAFYRALSTGTMGVVAPIAALGVVVPVIVGVAQGDRPSGLQIAGIAVAISGVVLASGPELAGAEGEHRRAAAMPLLLAVAAAAGFGVVFVALEHGARTSTVMTLVVMRSVSVVLLLLVALVTGREQLKVGRRDVPMLAVIGCFDVGANATFAYASRHGLLSVVAVLSSLYPAVTALLARSIHSERLRSVQVGGVVAALAGVCLIAAAGTG
ncbi:MAG: DMT family transporter [Frankiaceae bacterium]|nr:DMT family transporter [Frankiaceae bacterium]